jgi:hypothetical protein
VKHFKNRALFSGRRFYISAQTIAILGIVVGSVGIFFGFYFYFPPGIPIAANVVSFCSVGFLGVISFIYLFFLYKSDAQRMGWKTEHPDWQFEVDFANPAFGLVAICASPRVVGLGGAWRHADRLWDLSLPDRPAERLSLDRWWTKEPCRLMDHSLLT